MSPKPTYLLDANVFIGAKNNYYHFDICPGFWKSLLHHHQTGDVYSIDPVRNEVPKGFFRSVATREVEGAYLDIIAWVKS